MSIKIPALLCCLSAAAFAAIAPGQNAYLPPKQGYDYPKPDVPFITRPPIATLPPTVPPYRPSVTRPPYRPPVTSTPYRPPVTQPPRPTYGPPPTSPPYRPPVTLPPYRPPVTQPPYRPPVTQPPRPTYGPPPSPGIPPRPGTPPPFIPGQPIPGNNENDHLLLPHKPAEPFQFNYAVKEPAYGNDYSHNAINDGDETNGEYRVQLPDGRTQVVKYKANWASGFHAKISYEGNPSYPQYPGRIPTGPVGPSPVYPSPGPRPTPSYPSPGPRPNIPSYPSPGPRPNIPSYPSPSYPTPSYPSPSYPTPSYPSPGPRPNIPSYPSPSYPTPNPNKPSFPTPTPSRPSYPNPVGPGVEYLPPYTQKYSPGGGYSY